MCNIVVDDRLSELRRIVYLFTNITNGKVYVGCSINSFPERYGLDPSKWYSYAANKHFQSALENEGYKNFIIKILDFDLPNVALDALESYYIAKFKSNNRKFGYNKTSGGRSAFSHNEEVRKTMSSSAQGKFLKKKMTSRFIGVCKNTNFNSWKSIIGFNGKYYQKGFKSETDAAIHYDKMAIILFGPTARLNFEENRSLYLSMDLTDYIQLTIIPRKTKTSKYINVIKKRDKFYAHIQSNYKGHHIGVFADEDEAGKAADRAILALDKTSLSLNFPELKDHYLQYSLDEFIKQLPSRQILNPSGFKGVHKFGNHWRAIIKTPDGSLRTKHFKTPEEANDWRTLHMAKTP